MSERGSARYCQSCGTRLARDHDLARCASCQRRIAGLALAPPEVPADFWTHERMREALSSWHIGQVMRVYRHHPFHEARPLSQELVAGWLGLTQTQLSRIENGPPIKDLDKLIHWARTLHIPADLLWFKLPGEAEANASPAERPSQTLTLPVVFRGKPMMLPIGAAVARHGGFDGLLDELTNESGAAFANAAYTLPTQDADELEHVAAVLDDARRYLDGSVVSYLRQQLDRSKADDGNLGPARALPLVLGILGAISEHVREVKPDVRCQLLALGADGAEFAGWLYRDLHDHPSATYWYDRAMEWAQAANDTAMQGYLLLKKSQMAYEERDAHRVAMLAEAAQCGPWHLPAKVRVEVTQQGARGLAMLGEPLAAVERKLDEAKQLFAVAGSDDRPEFGAYFDAGALVLREASAYIEAGKPTRAASLFSSALARGGLPRRDEGYYRARRAASCALSGEPDEAAAEGLAAWRIAKATNSQRTTRELERVVRILTPWSSRPGPRELAEALRG